MISSNCDNGLPLNPNGPVVGLKKRQMGAASWTDGGSPPASWLGGAGGGTGSSPSGVTGGTASGGSAPVAAPSVAPAGPAPAAVVPPVAVVPASPVSAPPTAQGQAPGGNQLLFAGAPKLSNGLAYVLAVGLATSAALLF
jgi:hypothetical protein